MCNGGNGKQHDGINEIHSYTAHLTNTLAQLKNTQRIDMRQSVMATTPVYFLGITSTIMTRVPIVIIVSIFGTPC